MFAYFNMDDYGNSSQKTNEWQEIQPYMFEPSKNEDSNESYDSDDESTSTEEEEEGIDHEFEAINILATFNTGMVQVRGGWTAIT